MEIAIDAGKKKSHFVAEAEGKTIDEGHVPTTKEGFERMLAEKDGIKAVIVGSSSTIESGPILLRKQRQVQTLEREAPCGSLR